jgi:segregation and condensation protein A
LNEARSPSHGWALQLDGFEGPLDLLLELARHQKVDLAGISVLDLVNQYLDAVDQLSASGALRLEKAADWLVMAAWLTWLKSRLLLPKKSAEAAEAEQAAQVLTDRLAQLEQIRSLATWLGARPQIGRDICLRGAPSAFSAQAVTVDLALLLKFLL